MVTYWPVEYSEYAADLKAAREQSPRVKEATTPPEDMPTDALYILSEDGKSGYGVTSGKELIGLFSLIKGRGGEMMFDAINLDEVQYLDCFDGFLPSHYEQYGFVEYKREPNWTEGGPDVVYMRMQSSPLPVGDLSSQGVAGA